MAPKITEEHAEARREQILDAAFRCMAEKGFHRASMREICAEAGLSVGAVYRYFKSKEEILEAMAAHERDMMGAVFARAESLDPMAATDDVVQTFFGQLAGADGPKCALFAVALWGEATVNRKVRDTIAPLRGELIGYLTRLVERMQASGHIGTHLNAESVARVMLATHNGLVVQLAVDDRVDVGKYMEAVAATRFGVELALGHGQGEAS